MAAILRDFRYSLRTLRKSPVFLAVAVLSLALGIGANTAIFTLIYQLILQPLPVRDPEQLVMLAGRGKHYGGNNGPDRLSYPMYQEIRDKNQVFSGMFCTYPSTVSASFQGATELIGADFVSGNYFPVLGIGAAAGRVFTASDDLIQGGHPLAVLSYGYWRARFGADPGIVGKQIVVNGRSLTIIGVSPAGFDGVEPGRAPQIRIPITMKDDLPRSDFARLNTNRFRWARGLRPPEAGDDSRESASRPAAAVPPDPEPGSDGETLRQGIAIRQTGVPEDVDGGDARVEGPVESAQGILEAAFRADGHRQPGAADCLLESGEPVDCPCFGAAEGDRRSPGVGRGARQPDPPTPFGESCAGGGRRVSGRRSGGDDRPGVDRLSALRTHSALVIQHAGLDRARLHLRDLSDCRGGLRIGSGAAIHAAETRNYLEGSGRRRDPRRLGRIAQGAGGGAGVAVPAAVDRRRVCSCRACET